ncbi:MAG: PTS sugar transporter subunit IIB [Erysipelotrichaceae bacterium]|nr:PTS sugar transporter subunit IIB [Erysipelotrichaceae bacterium]
MIRILLICNAGMSTSILTEMMKQDSEYQKLGYIISCSNIINIERSFSEYDIILLAPQVRHIKERIVKTIKYYVPILVINNVDYATYNIKNTLLQIEKSLKEK